jgi:hypothetical protein
MSHSFDYTSRAVPLGRERISTAQKIAANPSSSSMADAGNWVVQAFHMDAFDPTPTMAIRAARIARRVENI